MSKVRGMKARESDLRRLAQLLNRTPDEIKREAVRRLQIIGEACVKEAREKGSYRDRTGNLRSSIGYVILSDGSPVVNGSAEQVPGPQGNGSEGPAAAKELLSKLSARYKSGVQLIICAGMSYAVYVEAKYHKDVLTSAELRMDSLAARLFKKWNTSKL